MDTKEIPKTAPRIIPWAAIVILLLAALLYAFIQYTFVRTWGNGWQILYDIPFLLILGFAIYWLANRILALQNEGAALQSQLNLAEHKAVEATQRLSAILRLKQQFLDAEEDHEIIHAMLPIVVETTGASGASLVPLDQYGQPMLAINYGVLPANISNAWVEYLASPAIRERCNTCQEHNHLSTVCPLLNGPFMEATGMFCVPLRKGEREFGVLNLYIAAPSSLSEETRAILQSIVDETARALESNWLRKRELGALRQLQGMRQKADLTSLLTNLLENACQSLEADFALMVTVNDKGEDGARKPVVNLNEELIRGKLPANSRPFITGILQGVLDSGEPVALGNVSGDPVSPPELKAILAAPLLSHQGHAPLGSLLVGNRRAKNFHQRQLTMLQTVAAQVALVIQSNRQLADLEYKTMIEERTRLAREIHDGLAQTLGFLKLQVAQMQNYLERGDVQRLQSSLRTYYQTLAEAYGDARNAIDGLRISPVENGIQIWLPQVVDEFQENVGEELLVSLECLEARAELPPEVQAQLIRILQEALSNVRKHAGAEHVWVRCTEENNDLVLEIRDDGQGFSPEDVPGPSQHGLRGMRERVELIGADFQIVSLPQKGTTVRVSLPLKTREMIL